MARRRLVLLQIRAHPGAEEQERHCFEARCGVGPEELRPRSLVREPNLTWEDVADADAVLIGGAGGHSALDDHPFTEPLSEVVLRIIDEGRPLFGSCWGHQFLGRLLGGQLVYDLPGSELGTYDTELTDAGRKDPLFGDLPNPFPVQLGHHDRVSAVPQGVEVLARSELCDCQAIRVADKPVYGTQFHSEMSADDMRARLDMYREAYAPDPEQYHAVRSRLRESSEADGLLARFLALFT